MDINHESTTTTVRLVDYRPPAWRVTDVALRCELGIDSTRVHSKLTLAGKTGEPVSLDGEDVELVTARLDGRTLAPGDYVLDAKGLTVRGAHDGSVLELDVQIAPMANSQLCGLYLSGTPAHGFLLTQCEAQGFRRITFFPDRPDVLARYDVTLVADQARFPILLAGGEAREAGELDGGRHFARFVDPHPKPSYLFALVAGHLEKIERAYRTADGHDVTLRLWAEADAIGRCGYAMEALVRAMRWDEEAYGRNYDLPVFNVVATHDFNMGAMENKGLNIFNSKYLLADPDTTTDDEYRRIEAVIGHEYFHNWSGDRVTCRDWFQLSLKEGFTVFREHSFCEAMHSQALKRIEDVATLRRVQFPEDAGPLAHPVRPAEYQAIDNFYTATVYEKGAELIRMIASTLGKDGFRRGSDLYFSRFDGQAVTIDDLLAALGAANGVDLSPYLAWYAQAGTPEVSAHGEYDAAGKRYTLTLSQRTPPTARQPHTTLVPIPVNIALFAPDGAPIALRLAGETGNAATAARVLQLTAAEQAFTFVGVPAAPTPSLLRGFSAPVRITFNYTPAQLALLLQHETEGFDRWNAAQQLAGQAFDETFAGRGAHAALDAWLDALAQLFAAHADHDPALVAELLTPPSELELGARHTPFDPDAVHAARTALEQALAERLGSALATAYRQLHATESGALDAGAAARRRLKGRVLALWVRIDAAGAAAALAQFHAARGMTDRLSALSALLRNSAPQAAEALQLYRERFDGDALTLDKWFMLQATVAAHATLERVQRLAADPAFTLANPNRVQALLGAFARANPVAFHRPDGAAQRWFATQLHEIDARNPQLAARLAKAFEDWPRLEPVRRAAAREALHGLLGQGNHSPDLTEILTRMLAAGGVAD